MLGNGFSKITFMTLIEMRQIFADIKNYITHHVCFVSGMPRQN